MAVHEPSSFRIYWSIEQHVDLEVWAISWINDVDKCSFSFFFLIEKLFTQSQAITPYTLFGWREEEGREWKETNFFSRIGFGWQNYDIDEGYRRGKVPCMIVKSKINFFLIWVVMDRKKNCCKYFQKKWYKCPTLYLTNIILMWISLSQTYSCH